MTTGEDTRSFQLGISDTQLGLKLKSPKLQLGFLQLGLAGHYSLADLDQGKDKKTPLASINRFNATLTVKDQLIRGKFEVDPRERKLHYSKKLRLPFLNTDLLRLRLTAAWPSPEAAGGLLGRGLGVQLSLGAPERLHRASVVAQPPHYSLQLAPRLGPPRAVFERLGFPGSVFVKAHSTLHLTDAPTAAGLRARLDVHRLTAVVRLYDPDRVKPGRLGRNLARAARRLVLEDGEGEGAGAQQPAVVGSGAEVEAFEPDIIDRAAAKAREWAHAILVTSCVATRQLQEEAELAGQRLRGFLEGRLGAASS